MPEAFGAKAKEYPEEEASPDKDLLEAKPDKDGHYADASLVRHLESALTPESEIQIYIHLKECQKCRDKGRDLQAKMWGKAKDQGF